MMFAARLRRAFMLCHMLRARYSAAAIRGAFLIRYYARYATPILLAARAIIEMPRRLYFV